MSRSKKPIRAQALNNLAIALRYAIVSIYFYVWSYKTEIRQWLKVSSLGILSVFMLGLFLEVAAESIGPQKIHEAFSSLGGYLHGTFAFVIFAIAVAYLLWHHIREAKKPGYEYTFVKSLCDFMEGRRPGRESSSRPSIIEALKLFHAVFERAGVAHVSIHTPEGEFLKIDPAHVFPPESDAAFFVPLERGEGVAGAVYADMKPRYVPQLYFPFGTRKQLLNMFFPHAVKFTFRQVDIPGRTLRSLELGDELVDANIFKPPTGREFPFYSFLSVPLRSVRQDGSVGVLNFDFSRPDPLDKADIAMAVIFGIVLGAEIAEDTQT